jgi:hypothetical protein
MIGADGEMQGVSRAQAQLILVSETSRRAELQPRHRDDRKTVRAQPSK